MKPSGLWYSVGTEWKDWCIAEDFGCHKLNAVYRLQVDESKLLRLMTVEAIRAFGKKYHCGTYGIDWYAIARKWSGIEIAPYQWECRLDYGVNWYYGWDVASGCLWAPDVLLGYEYLNGRG